MTFTDGTRVTAADLNSNDVQLLTSTVLTADASAVLLNVPSGFNRLQLFWSGRCAGAVAASTAKVQFNGDTATHYNFILTQSNNGTTTTTDNTAASSMQMATFPGASATANYAGSGNFVIDNADANGFFPTLVGNACAFVTTSNMYNGVYAGQWLSTAAITTINLVMGSGNWLTGSSFSLYGLT